MTRASQWISERFENLIHRAQSDPTLLQFDILIVGSGYGGAIAAATLAGNTLNGRPLRIGVLERGDEYLTGMFPKDLAELPGHVRGMAGNLPFGQRQGLFDVRLNGDINVLTGNGIGGGSLINAGVMAEPLAEVFDERWPKALRAGADLDFTRARFLVGASQPDNAEQANTILDSDRIPTKYQGLQALAPSDVTPAAITVAMRSGPNQAGVDLAACNHCGDCVTGCNQGAKNSLDLNLLVQAKRKGVEIIAGVSVSQLSHHADSGWQLSTHLSHDKLRAGQSAPILLRADKVILAAGSLGSTEILMRSASAKLVFSRRLGQNFSGNGDAIAVGYHQQQPVNAIAWPGEKPDTRQIGPTITGILDQRRTKKILIEEMAVPNAMAQIFSEMYTTTHCLHELSKIDHLDHAKAQPEPDPLSLNRQHLNHTALYAIMGDDDADGQLELVSCDATPNPEGHLQVRWPEARDKEIFTRQIAELESLSSATVKGRVLSNPAWNPLPAAMASLFEAGKGPLLTVHPLGGCAMADEVQTGVVNDIGQVFNGDNSGGVHPGLVVLDGAIIPSALGINPALTISALALRASEQLRECWGLKPADANSTPDTRQRPVWRDTNYQEKIAATQIQVTERLSGTVELQTTAGHKKMVAEITLHFEPKAINDYIENPTRADARVARIKSATDKGQGHNEGPITGQSQLRLFEPEMWRRLTHNNATEIQMQRAALLTAPLSGSLEIMKRDRTGARHRIHTAMWAWFRNRGLRDVVQAGWPSKRPGSLTWREQLDHLKNLASHAGQVRLFEYQLKIHKPSGGWPSDLSGFQDNIDRYDLNGEKRIGYARRANPIQQLSDMILLTFPGMKKTPSAVILTFDHRHLARRDTPLISVVQEHNLVQSFADLTAFYGYFARLLITTHLWTFRKPDRPEAQIPNRFAGVLPGLPAPDIKELPVATLSNGLPISIRLTRYKNDTTTEPPLVMLHGYSASSTTWAHAAIPDNAARYFHQRGRDIWLVDFRTSAGFLSAMLPWHFEDVAFHDIPLAFSTILRETRASQCDVIAHCMGAAMLSMAVLKAPEAGAAYFKEREQLPQCLRHVVLSQVGPRFSFSPLNMTRGYILKHIRHLLGNLPFSFRPSDAPGPMESLLDRVLQLLPYPEHEFDRENPFPSGKKIRWSATRRRMDALYGRTFSLDNMPDRLLVHIDDLFGPLSMGTLVQTIHFALQEQITNYEGENIYATGVNFRRRWRFNTFSVHAADSGLADVGTAALLAQAMKEADCPYQQHIFEGIGHQDLMIGRRCYQVFDKIDRFFSGRLAANSLQTSPLLERPYITIALPNLGPIVGPIVGPIATLKTEPNAAAERAQSPVMLGSHIAAAAPDWVLFVEVNAHGIPLATLGDNETDLCRHFHLKCARGIEHQWLKFSLADRLPSPAGSFWQAFIITDQRPLISQLPLAAELPDNVLQLRNQATTAAQKTIADYLHHLLKDPVFLQAYALALALPFEQRQLAQIEWRLPAQTEFSFVIAACQYPAMGTNQACAYRSYERLGARLDQAGAPELLLLLGDQVYVDPTAGVGDPHSNHHRYVASYHDWLSQKPVRHVLRRLPSYLMPDDHEFANDWDREAGRAHDFTHFAPGLNSYLLFQRQLTQAPNMLDLTTLSNACGVPPLWQSFSHGEVSFFMADTRTERDGRQPADNSAKIMSERQFEALKTWLLQQPADTPKVVATSSMLLPRRLRSRDSLGAHTQSDAWDGYPAQLLPLLQFIGEHRINHLVFVSGDEHISSHAHMVFEQGGRQHTVHSIHSSGLHSPLAFVNTKAQELADPDRLEFPGLNMPMSCAINTRFYPSDGFALLQFERHGTGWRLNLEFDRESHSQRVQLTFNTTDRP